jgi:hypothetical protein
MTTLIYGVGPPAVDLGTAGNYVILTSTGVSTTGTTSVIGNIGVSPIAASSITGFGLIMNSSGTYSTSSLVTGRIYAADYTTPTPANLTTAIANMGTAYTDAAGRPNPNHTELYAGDLTGQTLVPGLYKWGSGVLISFNGVTLAGGPNDVWIFQIAQNLTVADGAIVTLSGGAEPQNIFWQVAGQTSIGTTAQFKGIILCQTLISMNTGASLNGRLLAQTAVTLNQNSVVQPANPTGVDDAVSHVVSGSFMESNYPNPFNPSTTIKFNIVKGERGILIIYNMKGQTVLQQRFDSGEHNFVWQTDGLASGVYLARLRTNTKIISRKINLVK